MKQLGITVIVPTACRTSRKESLARALDSVLRQEGVSIELIVVVNGKTYDRELLRDLQSNSQLRTVYLPTPSAPAAVRHGRALVSKDYFCFLDDDDEYLPGAFQARCSPMLADPDIDVVVTNGFKKSRLEELKLGGFEEVRHDPLSALTVANWLASCGGLYRTRSIPVDIFADLPSYFEWTIVAFRLAQKRKKIVFVDHPTFRIHESPDSISNTEGYRFAQVNVIEHMLSAVQDKVIAKRLRGRLCDAYHNLSDYHLERNEPYRAWKLHLQSLIGPGGIRYALFTRKLFFSTFVNSMKGIFTKGPEYR